MLAVFALLAFATAAVRLAAWQEEASERSAPAQTAKPGKAEMDRLKFCLGEWNYTEELPEIPFCS